MSSFKKAFRTIAVWVGRIHIPYFLLSLFLVVALYVAFVMGMSTISTMAAILVLYYHHHLPNYRVPRIIRVIFFQVRNRSGWRLFLLFQGLGRPICAIFVLFQGLAGGISIISASGWRLL